MATEFEQSVSPTTDDEAEMVRGVGRTLEDMLENLQRKAKKHAAAGEDDAAFGALEEMRKLHLELRELKANNPGITWSREKTTTKTHAPRTTGSAAVLSTPSNALPRAIVVSALIIAGAILLSVILATGANWYYAEMIFVLAAYLVWQHWL
jgi:hypothetical protein